MAQIDINNDELLLIAKALNESSQNRLNLVKEKRELMGEKIAGEIINESYKYADLFDKIFKR